jgi:hypothetical protein
VCNRLPCHGFRKGDYIRHVFSLYFHVLTPESTAQMLMHANHWQTRTKLQNVGVSHVVWESMPGKASKLSSHELSRLHTFITSSHGHSPTQWTELTRNHAIHTSTTAHVLSMDAMVAFKI